MKLFLQAPRLPLLLALVLGLPSVARAFPPAPYHRIYGLVRDEYGEPLKINNAQIIFETSSGVQVTGTIVPGLEPGVNYKLDLAMDSGIAPDLYKITALKPTAPFRIRVKIGTTTYLPMEMAANFAQLGKPAQSTRIDLTIGEDADGDGLPDAWQRLLASMSPTGAKTGPNDDPDGDGISNWNEYLAGTYAFNPESGFRLKIVPGPVPLLEFMVIRARTYTLFRSIDLENWTPIEFRISANPTSPSQANYSATDVHVLKVEPILPAGGVPAKYFFKVQIQ